MTARRCRSPSWAVCQAADEEPIIYSKDLRGIEYVVGEMEGRLGAPIYGMLGIEDLVKEYTAPDGVKMATMPWNLFELDKDDANPAMNGAVSGRSPTKLSATWAAPSWRHWCWSTA